MGEKHYPRTKKMKSKTFRIGRERISGSNIFEVEKSVISRKGGKILKNIVVEEAFAKVTTRQVKKRSNENVNGK